MLTNKVNYSGLSDVAAFVCVVETGSFTAAAEKLNTSKSVVSKYVSRLEDRLSVKLFTRTTRKLTLTEIGHAFYNRACVGLKEIDEAEDEVLFLQGKPRGTLKINAPLSFGILHIAPKLGDFLKDNPEMNIDLSFSDSKIDMIKLGYDLTIRITDKLEGSLIARKIAPSRHVIVAAPDYIKKHGNIDIPQALMSHNVITYEHQKSRWEWEFLKNGLTERVGVSGTIQMNSSIAIRESVLAGVGISRMPSFLVGDDIKSGKLIRLLPDYQLPELSIYLIFASRKHLAPKLRSFIDFMIESFQGTPSWDQY